MAYDDGERSDFLGRDIRLYQFRRGQVVWCYCDADRDTPYGIDLYKHYPIQDDGMKQKGDVVMDDFAITVPLYCPIIQMFNGTPPSQLIKVVMRQLQYGDTEAPIVWTGYVSSVKFRDAVTSDIICNTQVAYLSRKGLRIAYERGCPHVLYDTDCTVDKEQWAEAATIHSLSGNSFIIALTGLAPSAPPVDRFTNGLIEWSSSPGLLDTRTIQEHNDLTNTITLLANTDGLVEGQTVTLYPGCRRTPLACRGFNNIANYGGFPFMPGRSPFDGDPVF